MKLKGIITNNQSGVVHAVSNKSSDRFFTMCKKIVSTDSEDYEFDNATGAMSTVTCKNCIAGMMDQKNNAEGEFVIILDKANSEMRVFPEDNDEDILQYLKNSATDDELAAELVKHPSESRYAIFKGRPISIVPEVETTVHVNGISVADTIVIAGER